MQIQPELQPLPPPRQPFAGFVLRVSEFAIDLVLLYFFAYTLELAFRKPLLELGPTLQLLWGGGTFAYFWLANGPVGKGVTLGKAILDLRVVRIDGNPLTLGQSFVRTLVQLPYIFLIAIAFGVEAAGLPVVVQAYVPEFFRIAVVGVFLTHAYCIVTHPQKAAWYDELVGSRVVPQRLESGLLETLKIDPEPTERRQLRMQRRTSLLFFGIVTIFLGVELVANMNRPAVRRNLQFLDLIGEMAPMEGYRVKLATVFTAQDRRLYEMLNLGFPDKESEVLDEDAAARETNSDARRAMCFLWKKTKGPARPEDMEDPGVRAGMAALVAQRDEIWAQYLEAVGDEKEMQSPPPEDIVCYFTDDFRFVIVSLGAPSQWTAAGPFDPQAGPLRYEWIETSE